MMTVLRREALGRQRGAEGLGDHAWNTVEGKDYNVAREVMF